MTDGRRPPTWLAGFILVVGLAAALGAACGGSDEAGEPTAANDHAEGETGLHVSLTEWAVTGEGAEALPAVGHGDVTFEVHNDGTTPHNLVIIGTDTDPGDLPIVDSAVDEEAAGEVLHRTADLNADGVETFTVNLDAGRYTLICNILGHYERGMFTELIVE